jgi:hypothetical protein
MPSKQISSHCFVATDLMKSEKQTKGGRQKAKMKYNSNVKATMLIYYYTSISDEASSLAPGLPLAIFKHTSGSKMAYQPPSSQSVSAFEDPQNNNNQQNLQPIDNRSRCQKIKDLDTKTVISYLRYANLCNAMCIITAGIVTVATLGSGSLNLTSMFIGLYIDPALSLVLCCLILLL